MLIHSVIIIDTMECSMEYDFKNRRGINIFCKYWNPESGNESIQKTVSVSYKYSIQFKSISNNSMVIYLII